MQVNPEQLSSTKKTGDIWVQVSQNQEQEAYDRLLHFFENSPIPARERLGNLALYLDRGTLAHLLFMHDLYQRIINTHGVIVEFGTRWGRNLSLFTTLRSIYEPYNITRRVIGFDSFEGFPTVHEKDGDGHWVEPGLLSLAPNYEAYLSGVLEAQEHGVPKSHLKRFELVKGDICETFPAWLERHPETVIALAFIDVDLYEPTKVILEHIRPYLAKNSIVAFDELCYPDFPGETVALRETWGTSGYRIVRNPMTAPRSFVQFD